MHSTFLWFDFISRPYIDLKDKSASVAHFEKLKKLWDKRDILIVEGENSRSGVGNDLLTMLSQLSVLSALLEMPIVKFRTFKKRLKSMWLVN